MTLPAFSVVTVIHNSAKELDLLLTSLQKYLQTKPQVIVVDNGSTDNGAEVAKKHHAQLITLSENLGFGGANNIGLNYVQNEITVLLNPDIELIDQSLLEIVELAHSHNALFAPRLLNSDNTLQRSAHPMPGTVEALLPAVIHPHFLPHALKIRADPWRSKKPRRVGWAIAAALTARTETLRRLGPFDPQQFLFYEDLDLCLRAAKLGIPTELHPEIQLRHSGGHSTEIAYKGEPHELLAHRRREVVAQLGKKALLLDDLANGLTFFTRAIARRLLRRNADRELQQLRALYKACYSNN